MMKTDEDRNVIGVLGGWLEWSQGSSRGLILDWMGSQQSDRDLNNLTVSPHQRPSP